MSRPRLLVGFAAETEKVVENAVAKRVGKGSDWVIANDVSGDVMGGPRNRVHLMTRAGIEDWPEVLKEEVARRLVGRVSGGVVLIANPRLDFDYRGGWIRLRSSQMGGRR